MFLVHVKPTIKKFILFYYSSFVKMTFLFIDVLKYTAYAILALLWPLLELLSWYPLHKPRNSFADRTPVDFIYVYLIFRCVSVAWQWWEGSGLRESRRQTDYGIRTPHRSLSLCEGNHRCRKRPIISSFDVFSAVSLDNLLLNKQWFETPCDVTVMRVLLTLVFVKRKLVRLKL